LRLRFATSLVLLVFGRLSVVGAVCWPKEIVGVFVNRTRAKAVVLMLSDDAAATSDWRKHGCCAVTLRGCRPPA